MGYHSAMYRSRGGYMYARSRGGFLSGLVKGIGKVAGTIASATPIGRVITTGVSLGSSLLGGGRSTTMPALQMPAAMPGLGGPQLPTQRQRQGGVEAIGVSPLGTVGIKMRKHRHMNAGNAKAARRSIRRIKAVRHLLTSIERELPKRTVRAASGSRGVITRAEAARALRA